MTLFPTIGDGQQPKSRGLYTHKDPLYPTKRSLDTGSYEILSLIWYILLTPDLMPVVREDLPKLAI